MRSWTYYIEIVAQYMDGREENRSAVYVVALPLEENLNPVDMECYASEYAPFNLAINYGKAYAVGIDFPLESLEDYQLKGYREDLELYVFKEGLSFEEGLEEVYKILYASLEKEGLMGIMPILDVGSPPEEVMIKCLKRAVST